MLLGRDDAHNKRSPEKPLRILSLWSHRPGRRHIGRGENQQKDTRELAERATNDNAKKLH